MNTFIVRTMEHHTFALGRD